MHPRGVHLAWIPCSHCEQSNPQDAWYSSIELRDPALALSSYDFVREVSTSNSAARLRGIIDRSENELLSEWIVSLQKSAPVRKSAVSSRELEETARSFLGAVRQGLESGNISDFSRSEWDSATEYLTKFSAGRAEDGFTPTETAMFVFSLKEPLFARIRQEFSNDPVSLAEQTWNATVLLDGLGLLTADIFLKTREDVIRRQQQDLLEISTPVVRLSEGILALPLIGTLDSARTQVVMQNLLEAIVNNSASIAIIDITGVPTVDTLVAQHLLRTVAAARLMGADCIISGIRPQIAQTIIHLGVDLADVMTKATLADAFQIALKKLGFSVVAASKRSPVN
jgi:rsbT co-antagonist protein RsbR